MRLRYWLVGLALVTGAAVSNLFTMHDREWWPRCAQSSGLSYYPHLIVSGRYACIEVRRSRTDPADPSADGLPAFLAPVIVDAAE